MPRIVPAVFVLVLLSALPCRSESVDLTEALHAAVAQRPAVAAARQRATAARSAVGEARSAWLPRLTFRETFRVTDEPAASLFMTLNQERLVLYPDAEPYNDPGATRDFETRLELEQALFDPAITYAVDGARKHFQAARARSLWSAQKAAFDAFQGYLRVQQAGAARAWAESSLREAREIARLAAERETAGTGLKADTLRARVLEAEAERRLVAVENDLKLARRHLALAMGRDGGEVDIAGPVALADLEPPAAGPAPESCRGDLQAARLEAEAAGLQRRGVRAGYLPRVGLQAAYGWHDEDHPFDPGADSWQVGAGLTWTLFDGLRREHRLARSAAEERAVSLEAEELRREIALREQEALLRAEEAELQLVSARRARDQALESRHLLQQRYAAGLSDLSDLLATQAALDRARYDAEAAHAGLLLARGNLRLQQGIFLKTLLPSEEDCP